MEESVYRFRTALSGFHKGDVTAYIEKTASEHRSALLEMEKTITQLQKENRSLQQQVNLLMLSTPSPAPAEPVEKPAPVVPVEKPAPAPLPETAPLQSDMAALELQAYRRAEAVEHAANVRARQLYRQLEGMCANTIDEVQVTDTAVKQAIELMMQQASSLEQAYQTLNTVLAASREKLEAMNELFIIDEENE